ncbi:MAG TPA: hypothetical protein VGM39_00040 [Kofleriaceae bacterium]
MICAFLVGCAGDESFFPDKGTGTWVAIDGTPALGYRAIWSDFANDVYAVGSGGAAHYDGAQWETLAPLSGSYRAVWGRSEQQVWIGGDDAMWTSSLTGWEPQELRDHSDAITHYSVLDIEGDKAHEYALVQSGGRALLFVNTGTAWQTVYWTATSARLPLDGKLIIRRDGSLIVAGNSAMVLCTVDRDLPIWDAIDASAWYGQPPLPLVKGLTGGDGYWAGAGRDAVMIRDDDNDEFSLLVDQRDAIVPRNANAIYGTSASRMFVVGAPVVLRAPDVSGVTKSPVEACDDNDCVLEPVFPPTQIATFSAVTGSRDAAVFATSDETVFQRAAK